MRFKTATHALILSVVAVAIVAVPAVESVARPRKPPIAAPPPPPPIPAGPVGLPERMLDDAAAYDGYMRHAAALSPGFTDAGAVSQALSAARAYQPKSLVRGAIAYAAIAALKDRPFVDALRKAGNTPENRQAMVGYIIANPAYLYQFSGYDQAAALARAAIGPTALQLYGTGKIVRQAAYDVQKQGWSKAEVVNLKGRLADSEAAAMAEMTPDPERLAVERQAIAEVYSPTPEPDPADAPLASPYTPLIAHALQLAAVAALGEASEDSYDRLAPLSVDDDTSACLLAAKRNFHQCLAVAKPNYEDIFCMGQHALRDTGACLVKAAGLEVPAEPPPPAPPVVKHATLHKTHHHKA